MAIRSGWSTRRLPLVVDRRLDLAAIILFAIYGLWGVATTYVNTSILQVEITFYPVVWGAMTGLVALLAFASAVYTFFLAPPRVKRRLWALRLEMASVAILAGHIAVYPALVFIGVFFGDLNRPDLAILSLSYIVFPVWRVLDLISRIQQLTILKEAYDG